MDLKIKKEKTPEVKFKKEMEIAVHKKNLVSPQNENRTSFHIKDSADFLGKKKTADGKDFAGNALKEKSIRDGKTVQPAGRSMEREKQGASARSSTERARDNGNRSMAVNGKTEQDKMRRTAKDTASRNHVQYGNNRQGGEQSLLSKDAGNTPGGLPPQAVYQAGILTNAQAKEKFRQNKKIRALSDTPKIKTKKTEMMIKGVRRGGKAVLTQLDGGEEVNEAFHAIDTARRPLDSAAEKRKYAKAEEKLKIKQADQKISSKQFQKELKSKKKEIAHKQTQQAIRQRKLQYVINKLTGSGENDSIVQVAKDIVRVKAEFVMLKVVKFIGALLAPLFGILFMAAFPVVLIVGFE